MRIGIGVKSSSLINVLQYCATPHFEGHKKKKQSVCLKYFRDATEDLDAK